MLCGCCGSFVSHWQGQSAHWCRFQDVLGCIHCVAVILPFAFIADTLIIITLVSLAMESRYVLD